MATEKRLIDANALDGILKDFESRYQKEHFALSAKAISNARQIVYAMKTVDAVEVVRCKDCKHWDEDALWCNINSAQFAESHYNWYGEDFCSYGERKDNE
jgi:hypothetical protein